MTWLPRRRTTAALVAATMVTATACTSVSDEPDPQTVDAATTKPPGERQPRPARPEPERYVVTLGDSYISGEGARWAGNTNGDYETVDALGTDAYYDAGDDEQIPRCHRATAAIADLRIGDVGGHNLACSGAQTESYLIGTTFKPGLDFYRDRRGNVGQALALQRFATHHEVSDVVVSIGGNDFNFGAILLECVVGYVASLEGGRKEPCRYDAGVAGNFTESNVDDVTEDIADALLRVGTAMRRAGYAPADYDVVVQNYPSPLAPGRLLRYPQNRQRENVAGCPIFDVDATWADRTVVPIINSTVRDALDRSGLTNASLVDMTRAFDGHRLCERGVRTLDGTGLETWKDPAAVDRLEWVNRVYLQPPGQIQESAHPNYWGMLALRSCVRAAVRGPSAQSGTCVRSGPGRGGEPSMTLR